MEATEDFSQLRLRFIDPTQYSYELIRPVVLYAERVGDRSEATQVDPATIRMRVWERGGMITQACGSGACAAAVVTARRGLTGRKVTVRLDGGDLLIDWREDGVWMTGPAALVFEGRVAPELMAAA